MLKQVGSEEGLHTAVTMHADNRKRHVLPDVSDGIMWCETLDSLCDYTIPSHL